jgi:4-hydroxybenzoate polyprenyltransferase
MSPDAERALTLGTLFTLLFVGSWLAFSGVHRHLVFVICVAFVFVCLLFNYWQKPREQDPT